METAQTLDIVKSNLAKLSYVKRLKNLSEVERQILAKKFNNIEYLYFRLPMTSHSISETLKKITNYLTNIDSKLIRRGTKILSVHRTCHGDIRIHTRPLIPDSSLIRMQKEKLIKEEKKQKQRRLAELKQQKYVEKTLKKAISKLSKKELSSIVKYSKKQLGT